ncbi:hypothetical protein ZBT109_2421 [Zymobacter palmae]|uniref:Uncharacterized protein n=1 Tax=Zymobacter palmae TaxID=33074 RepID=A0A348HHP9_9GAMM|nr:hypothetical protein ZBT109_2421 [Zymobacter palmae]
MNAFATQCLAEFLFQHVIHGMDNEIDNLNWCIHYA